MSKESPKSVNELYAWGYNKFGQLGTGDTTNRLTPQIVGFFNDKKLKKIDAGEYHSLALTETGDLYAWGTNANGELGITGSYQLTPQLVPFFSGKKVHQVATGGYHSLALTESGKLYAWGYNERGALGLGHTNDQSTPRQITFFEGKKIKSIAAGKLHSLVILDSGELYTWGQNNQGQLGVGHRNNELAPQLVSFFTNNSIVKVAAGEYHTLALTEHDELYSWGGNNFGQLGVGDTAEYLTPHLISTLEGKGIKNFVCGSVHSIALLECGEVYVWGRSLNGELGLGSPNHKTTPQLLPLKTNVVFVAAGGHHSCAVSKEGEVYVWGLNNNGSLGLNHTTDQQTPHILRQLSDEKTVIQAALGGFHTIALHGAKVNEKAETRLLDAVLDEWKQCRSLCDLDFLGEKWYSPLVKLNCPKLLKKENQTKLIGTKWHTVNLLNQFVHFMDFNASTIEEIAELLQVGQMVSFKTLVKKCNLMLYSLLTMENVWTLLKLLEKSDEHVDMLFDFIKKNKTRYGDELNKLIQNNLTADLKARWTKYLEIGGPSSFKLSSSLADLKIKKLKHLFSMREETKDCEIKVGSVYVPAHKLILALHNDFFRRCFLSDMIESRKGVISIPNEEQGGISVSAMQGLMYYLYTSDLNHLQNVNDCISILLSAPFFCLSPETKPSQDHYKLIKHCQRVVLSELSLENCLSMLKIVWEHKSAMLQDKILGYVVQHYFELNEKHEDQVLELPNRLLWLITNRVIIGQQQLIMQQLNVNNKN